MEINGHKIEPGADLSYANLRGADLYGANLHSADLHSANLRGADLRGANLRGANLRDANLYGANLYGADLRDANLYGANLPGANLYNAKLRGANLRGASLPPFQIPQEGELIVWKKLELDVLAKLKVPADAKRTASLVGRKCRAERVEVLWTSIGRVGYSGRGGRYSPGEIVRPDSYDDDPRVECTNGIHFFLTREEAENW